MGTTFQSKFIAKLIPNLLETISGNSRRLILHCSGSARIISIENYQLVKVTTKWDIADPEMQG